MTRVRTERAELCASLLAAGPDAPTLCGGWTTHDLAAHLWVRENDPLAAAGIMFSPLSGLLERRMAAVQQRWSYAELIDRLRQGPPRFSPTRIPKVDEAGNLIEFLIHHEDVRRGGAEPQPPRALDPELEDWVWSRLRLMSKLAYRGSAVGVVLERNDRPGEPQTLRAAAGTRIVTVIGRPSELMLFGSGRQGAADVQLVGEPDAVAELAPNSF